MTRRELEEAVMNLEYLLSHRFDASKTAEYDNQLQAFRRELRALDQQQYSLATSALKSNHKHRFYRWLQR